jgi:hypothetical protein
MSTNLIKDTKFRIGGYARTKAWGTRIYKVLDEFMADELFTRPIYENRVEKPEEGFFAICRDDDGNTYYQVHVGEETISARVLHVTLMKVGETNRGNFRFTGGKPFTVYAPLREDNKWWRSGRDTLTWYYPVKATKAGFSFNVDSAHVSI